MPPVPEHAPPQRGRLGPTGRWPEVNCPICNEVLDLSSPASAREEIVNVRACLETWIEDGLAGEAVQK
jgi:hypothetical protein